jgi:hypothetical protein
VGTDFIKRVVEPWLGSWNTKKKHQRVQQNVIRSRKDHVSPREVVTSLAVVYDSNQTC